MNSKRPGCFSLLSYPEKRTIQKKMSAPVLRLSADDSLQVRYGSKRIASLQHSFREFQTRGQKLGLQLDCARERTPCRLQVAPLQCG